MFIHNFKYSLKTLFKNKALIFWTFAFPIILGTLFNMAFSNISNSEKLEIIDIAIVNNDEFTNNDAFKTTFENLSDETNSERLFNTRYVDEDEAKKLLDEEKIVGYLKLEENEPKLVFIRSGINQTVFKYVVEEVMQTSEIMGNLYEQEMKNQMAAGAIDANIDYQEIYENVMNLVQKDDVKLKNTSNKNLDYMMIEFYTLIAMACLYGGMLSMTAINQNLANISNKGKRIAVAPIKKSKVILSSVLASYIAQLIGLAILFAYTIFVLKVNYGENTGLVILLALVGSLAGLSVGIAIGTLIKSNENAKTGILISITMLGCFLAGMMGVSMKYIVDKNVPIINKLNPANMITDGFYSLYYYDTLDRYFFNLAGLLVFAVILITISFFSLRRQKYDSI